LIYYFWRSWSSERLILYIFVAVYTAIHLLSWALIRYRLPVDAILLVFASAAIVDILAKLTRGWGNAGRSHKSTPIRSVD